MAPLFLKLIRVRYILTAIEFSPKAEMREFTKALALAKAGEACNTAENSSAKSILTHQSNISFLSSNTLYCLAFFEMVLIWYYLYEIHH